MRVSVCVLALVVFGGFFAAPAWSDSPKAEPDKKKPDPNRLKGMKAAVVDIEAGKLKLKYPPLPAPVWQGRYVDLLKKECGVEWETVRAAADLIAEMGGYDDVMIVEIEHRFGKGILEKLQKKAEAESRESKEKK
jgi:hypothetical protein